MAEIDILIVSWNVRDLLAACLRSILAQPGAGNPEADGTLPLNGYRVRVWVVDNASQDDTPNMLRAEFGWVQLIVSEENLGFTGGNNLGLQHCRGDYVLLLNPDTELAPGALLTLVEALAARAEIGIIGPRLAYGDGRSQPSRRRFPTLMMALFESTLLEEWWPHNRWARAFRMEDVPDDRQQRVDWLTGACLLTRRSVWDQIGLLDPMFFMYSEELDWCQRASQGGWGCLYVPEALVYHHEGQSSGQVLARRHYLFHSSKVLYWAKHHGALQAELLRCFLLCTFALQFVREGLKWLVGHRRDLRSARIAAYASVLKSGLRRPSATGR
ncbi:MAG: glycosyltransferase family 2 protein [Chloroflexi bacterium]|nr:glycosyltransferase family 2 protein [Chloroflexota bacterium]